MIFLFHEKAGDKEIVLEGDSFKHMIKARRQQTGDTLSLKNTCDTFIYIYTIMDSNKKEATLELTSSQEVATQNIPRLHLGWSVIDPKSIEKVLASLCEMGLSEISFIYSHRSQKNFKLDMKRLERIARNSMQQSGRYFALKLNDNVSLKDFLQTEKKCVVLDFCEETLKSNENFSAALLGPEGGFDSEEKELLSHLQVRRLNTPLVLKSESAALALVSKLLL